MQWGGKDQGSDGSKARFLRRQEGGDLWKQAASKDAQSSSDQTITAIHPYDEDPGTAA